MASSSQQPAVSAPQHPAYAQSPTGSSARPPQHERAWSVEDGDAEDDDGDGDGDGDDDGWHDDLGGHSPKRKRQKTSSRPISVSCERCKERKVKCDRGQPRCGWCVRNGQTCEYKERKKPGLRAGYGRELESRLDKLEGILLSHDRLLQSWMNAPPGALPQFAPPASSSPAEASQHHIPQAETALYMQPPAWMATGTAAVGTRFNGTSDPALSNAQSYSGSHAGMHISPAASGDMYAPSNPPLESPTLNIHAGALSTPENSALNNASSADQDFPPYDLLYGLTDLFFKHFNTWCPILHRRTTLDALFGPNPLEEADRILLHAIVATTLRFSTDARLTPAARERYHALSKQKVLLYGLENSSVTALQALVILALDILGSSNGPPGWNLLALITRSVVQLGLAVEATSASIAPVYPSIYTLRAMVLPEPKSFIEDESRRRLFWMVYLLDRYATISTAFEFALDDREIDRKLPCRDDLFARNQPVETRWFPTAERTDYSVDHPENLGSFSYYIEIVGIMSDIHRFLKKPVDIGALSDVEQWQQQYRRLDGRINAWKFSLPAEYGNVSRLFNSVNSTKVANGILVMLHVTYHTAVIRLHSSAAYPTTRSPIFTPSFSASQRCHRAVDEIGTIAAYVSTHGLLNKLGPPFAFSLWVAARVLLVHGSTIDHRVSPAIHPLVDALRELGRYWRVAERYATLLTRVLEEYADSERAAATGGGGGGGGAEGGAADEAPSSVRILADMRRTAYDLDFLISRQPRALAVHQASAVAAAAAPAVAPTAVAPGFKTTHPTPARTPAPNELEYLDVFDFFNLPRLPFPGGIGDPSAAGPGAGVAGGQGGGGPLSPTRPDYVNETHDNGAGNASASHLNEFNITNFMYDANADWFSKGHDTA